jgi:hypothetical protein
VAAAAFMIEDREEPRRIVDPDVRARAETVRRDAAAMTPVRTRTLQRGWRVVKAARTHGTWRVANYVPYAVYVEYGTRYMRAQAPLGRAAARAEARS